MRLLVVDWDYFFPNPLEGGELTDTSVLYLYDWGHKETPFFIESVWPLRAAGFLRRGLPLPGTSGEEIDFWSRFRFDPGVIMYVSESNADAARPEVLEGVREIWLFDAHADCGYRGEESLKKIFDAGSVDCEDWGLYAVSLGITLHVRYPQWKVGAFESEPVTGADVLFPGRVDRDIDEGDVFPLQFGRVFVCRSGAWVPPWLDEQFVRFVETAPVSKRSTFGEFEMVRRFDIRDAEMLASMIGT